MYVHILAYINFVSSMATVEEPTGVVTLTLQNNGSAFGTVCKYSLIEKQVFSSMFSGVINPVT